MDLENRIKEASEYEYVLTKEDEKNIVAKLETELIYLQKTFPDLPYLDLMAILARFSYDGTIIVKKSIDINGKLRSVTLGIDGTTNVKVFEENENEHADYYGFYLLHSFLEEIRKLKNVNDKVKRLEQKEGTINSNQRFKIMIRNKKIKKIINDEYKYTIYSYESLDSIIAIGKKILKRIKFPSYMETLDTTNTKEDRLTNLKFSEITKTINEIRRMANEMGIQDEAEFAITSIISYYQDLFQKYLSNNRDTIVLTIDSREVTSVSNAFNDVHDYYQKLVSRYNIYLRNKSIEEAKEVVEKIKIIPESVDNIISSVRQIASELGKSEEAEGIIADYVNGYSYAKMEALINYRAGLLLEQTKLKSASIMLNGYQRVLNSADQISESTNKTY